VNRFSEESVKNLEDRAILVLDGYKMHEDGEDRSWGEKLREKDPSLFEQWHSSHADFEPRYRLPISGLMNDLVGLTLTYYSGCPLFEKNFLHSRKQPQSKGNLSQIPCIGS